MLAAYPWPLAGHVALGIVVGLINFVTVWDGTAKMRVSPTSAAFREALALAESGLIILLVAWVSRTDFFYMEKRLNLGQNKSRGYTTSFLTGIVFAAGWTPCVGPILVSILAMAVTGERRGALLLFFYSLGLAIPFLLAGLLFNQLGRLLPKIYRYLPLIARSVVSCSPWSAW